jgi:hypothetical protein
MTAQEQCHFFQLRSPACQGLTHICTEKEYADQ